MNRADVSLLCLGLAGQDSSIFIATMLRRLRDRWRRETSTSLQLFIDRWTVSIMVKDQASRGSTFNPRLLTISNHGNNLFRWHCPHNSGQCRWQFLLLYMVSTNSPIILQFSRLEIQSCQMLHPATNTYIKTYIVSLQYSSTAEDSGTGTTTTVKANFSLDISFLKHLPSNQDPNISSYFLANNTRVVSLDLSSLSVVRDFADQIKTDILQRKLPPMNSIICNVLSWSSTTGLNFTTDGYESLIAVNHMAHLSLILRLLDQFGPEEGEIAFWDGQAYQPGQNALEKFPHPLPDDFNLLPKPNPMHRAKKLAEVSSDMNNPSWR